mmetsp:Transcript_65232/g.187604  ORF Transcript_65232/g.187604 Transcript_65232/m.187604 type:complete len:300 (+) Transcript_65232:418-1317(+)
MAKRVRATNQEPHPRKQSRLRRRHQILLKSPQVVDGGDRQPPRAPVASAPRRRLFEALWVLLEAEDLGDGGGGVGLRAPRRHALRQPSGRAAAAQVEVDGEPHIGLEGQTLQCLGEAVVAEAVLLQGAPRLPTFPEVRRRRAVRGAQSPPNATDEAWRRPRRGGDPAAKSSCRGGRLGHVTRATLVAVLPPRPTGLVTRQATPLGRELRVPASVQRPSGRGRGSDGSPWRWNDCNTGCPDPSPPRHDRRQRQMTAFPPRSGRGGPIGQAPAHRATVGRSRRMAVLCGGRRGRRATGVPS